MRRYWRIVLPGVVIAVILVGLLISLRSSLVFFNTPTEVMGEAGGEERLRLGGQVVDGTVAQAGEEVSFDVTDGRTTVTVHHSGAPQQMFQEGIGVVVEGTWDGVVFTSDFMLVSHDEQYRTEDGVVYEPGRPPGSTP
jgi:cytochrome c-type biogenesis protein CcmE